MKIKDQSDKPEPIHFGDLLEFSLWDRKIYFYINYIHPPVNNWMRSFCITNAETDEEGYISLTKREILSLKVVK